MKYSALMSVYKGDSSEAFINAIGSVISQSKIPDQIVIVIDGPVDKNLSSKISAFKFNGLNLVWLPTNVGLGPALNEGLLHCKNEFVLRMDADDTCSPLRAEKLIAAWMKADTSKLAAIGSNIEEFNPETEESFIISYPELFAAIAPVNYYRDPIGHASVMMRKSTVIEVGGYLDCLYFEDTYLWLRLLNNGYSVMSINEPLYRATIGNGFYERRSGWSYLKLELQHLRKFKREKLISLQSFIINCFMRPIIRLLPKHILKAFYGRLLRVECHTKKPKTGEHDG